MPQTGRPSSVHQASTVMHPFQLAIDHDVLPSIKYTSACARVQVPIHTLPFSLCLCACVPVCLSVSVCACARLCLRLCVSACMRVCVRACLHVDVLNCVVCVCVCQCARARACVCTCALAKISTIIIMSSYL